MQRIDVTIEEDFITLGQLLKNVNLISSGGMAKWYLNEFSVFINKEEEQRRGRKLYPNDIIFFPNDDLEVKILEQDA